MGRAKPLGQNDVLTTGEVARLCNVAPRTVSKWVDAGHLRGYRIPGSKDRRVPVHQLVRFMRAHGIPLGELDAGQTRVLLIDEDAELLALLDHVLTRTERYAVRTATSAFEGGALAELFNPHVIVVDVTLSDVRPLAMSRFLQNHDDLQACKLVAMSGALTDSEEQTLLQQGFAGCLSKPFDARQVMLAIEDAVAIVR